MRALLFCLLLTGCLPEIQPPPVVEPPAEDADADGFSVSDGDCDDTDASRYPGATEACDGVDNDCDGQVDDGDWGFVDGDGDGYGIGPAACDAPNSGDKDGDCNDTVAAVNPGAEEVCDGVDNDCDQAVDEDDDSLTDGASWYADDDADGFGSGAVVEGCKPAGVWALLDGDCDDADNTVYPGADEICDLKDNDCDGLVDAQDSDLPSSERVDWYVDADDDSFGVGELFSGCPSERPPTYASNNLDCDDADSSVHPGAVEICDGGIDNNCDGAIDDDDPALSSASATTYYIDQDGDGWGAATVQGCELQPGWSTLAGDCNDDNVNVNPQRQEICDQLDNDCNGQIDDQTVIVDWYADADGDGYGSGSPSQSCAPPAATGWALDDGDCDETRPDVHPNLPELCSTKDVDDDCDGGIDDDDLEGPTDPSSWHPDTDNDSYGDSHSTQLSCLAPSDWIANGDDCDDTLDAVHPGAQEVCNGRDDDCVNGTDDADPNVDPTSFTAWYPDTDGDNFGVLAAGATLACAAPADSASQTDDCNDSDATIYDGAPELCDNKDNDCDGVVDDNTGLVDWYVDGDGDGYGAGAATSSCSAPTAGGPWVQLGGDCDDGNPDYNPGASEVAGNLIDEDCNNTILCWADADKDGYGDNSGATVESSDTLCAQADGESLTDQRDCDDGNPDYNPGAPEVAGNLIDEDCNNTILCWADADKDGYGDDGGDTVISNDGFCNKAQGEALSDQTDCDDANAATNPGATELAGNLIDENCSTTILCWADADMDGYGDDGGATVVSSDGFCNKAQGEAFDDQHDCDDGVPEVHPNATEVCNGGVDDDCVNGADDADPYVDATTFTAWYPDTDGDNFGVLSAGATYLCTAPANSASQTNDCNDNDNTVYDGAPELCDGKDNDCDTVIDNNTVLTDWYVDGDSDGVGDGTATSSCIAPTTGGPWVQTNGDCDDANPAIHPGAAEVCNGGVDDDCANGADDADPNLDSASLLTWSLDSDGDGFGSTTGSLSYACAGGTDQVADATDCDDSDPSINPGATEVAGDEVDENCDGWLLCWSDQDQDGFGDANLSVISVNDSACLTSASAAATDTSDCDDTNAVVNPGRATDGCDIGGPLDNDCDGEIDEDPDWAWYRDQDGDGAGTPYVEDWTCVAPSGFVKNDNTDCDDTNPSIPAFVQDTLGDGVDTDCDQMDGSSSTCLLTVGPFAGYPTIASAIQAACAVAIVEVSPGTYYESVDFGLKEIHLIGLGSQPGEVVISVPSSSNGVSLSAGSLTNLTVTGASGSYAGVVLKTSTTRPIVLDTVDLNNNKGVGALQASSGTSLVIINSMLSYNSSSSNGGAVSSDIPTVIVNSIFTNNYSASSGGAVSLTDGGVVPHWLDGVNLINNQADSSGGGLFLGSAAGSTLSDNLIATGNSSINGDGGAIMANAALDLWSGSLTSNTAQVSGGGIAHYAGVLVLDQVQITTNTATTGQGGGVYDIATGVELWLDGLTVSGNNAPGGCGGGLHADGPMIYADGNLFELNGATDGAGVCAKYTSGSWTATEVTQNTASNAGGGVWSSFSTASWDDLLLDSNGAASSPGASFYYGSSDVTRLTAIYNDGSGAAITFNGGSGTLSNLLIYRTMGAGGAGLTTYTSGDAFVLQNLTVVGNQGHGLAMNIADGTSVDVADTVSAYNTNYGIAASGTNVPTLTQVYTWANGSGGAYLSGANVDITIELDPEFSAYVDCVASSPVDLSLRPGSPLFDAGSLLDPDGSIGDIGAYGGPNADTSVYDDLDGDGMYDDWEALFGVYLPLDDPDADGLDNLAELAAGTDPTVADTDGDTTFDSLDANICY